MAQKPKLVLDRLIFKVSGSHTIRHKQTKLVGIPCTGDQLVAKAATYTSHSEHKRRTSANSTRFEPVLSTMRELHTYVLNRTETGMDTSSHIPINTVPWHCCGCRDGCRTWSIKSIFVNNQLDAQFFSMYVYFYSLHVSGSHVTIIRRINCINTTSGICHCV